MSEEVWIPILKTYPGNFNDKTVTTEIQRVITFA